MQRRHETENIPIEILRSLITILDTGSFTKAGAALGLTQSAITAQMKRLQRLLGDELFVRGVVNVTLTEKGKFAADYARRIIALNDVLVQGKAHGVRVGLPPLYGNNLLRNLATQCNRNRLNVHLNCDSVPNLRRRFDAGHLDAFLDLTSEPSQGAVANWTESVIWISANDFDGPNDRPFQFINWPGSPSAEIAKKALNQSSIRYETPVVAYDVVSYLGAVQAALGYGVLAERIVPSRLRVRHEKSLPSLGPMHVSLKVAGVREGLDAVVTFLKEAAERLSGRMSCHAARLACL